LIGNLQRTSRILDAVLGCRNRGPFLFLHCGKKERRFPLSNLGGLACV